MAIELSKAVLLFISPLGLSKSGCSIIPSFRIKRASAPCSALNKIFDNNLSHTESINPKDVEAARNLGASKIDILINIIIPLSLRGFLVSGVLGFAHTIGEFGVVLMVGGNISGETRVLSVAIFALL